MLSHTMPPRPRVYLGIPQTSHTVLISALSLVQTPHFHLPSRAVPDVPVIGELGCLAMCGCAEGCGWDAEGMGSGQVGTWR